MRMHMAADTASRRRAVGEAHFIALAGIGMTVLGARLLVDERVASS
jgi:hypothetical protein